MTETSLRFLRLKQPLTVPPVLLRFGISPFLAGIDVLAWVVACSVIGWQPADGLLLLATLVFYKIGGLYRSRLTLSVLDDIAQLIGRIFVAGGLIYAGWSLGTTSASHSPPSLLETAALNVLAVVFLRGLGYATVRRVRSGYRVGHPTLILGAGRVGSQIATLLLEHAEYGLRPVGFLDADPLVGPADRPIPLLGSHDVLADTIVKYMVRDVMVAFGSLAESELVSVIRTCDRLNCEIFFVPRLFELHNTNRDMDKIWGLPLVRLRRAAFRTLSWRIKRAVDVMLSGLALLALSPVLGVIALLVRLEGGAGIIFRQTRVGLDHRRFELLKFRSLRPADDAESATRWNVAHDDRLGPVGKFLRQTSLDELPQLWNILRGSMSIVGPRPERPHFVQSFASTMPRYVARHRVPAGLTGWAQVHGLRGDTSIEERARFDNYYIENWSLWLDVRIIVMTVVAVLRRAGG